MKEKTAKNRFDESLLEPRALAAMKAAASRGEKLAVALSGGSDSVFALAACIAVCGAEKTAAMHFNHAVRKGADADEEFCRSLCRKLGVEFVSRRRDSEMPRVSEGVLRELRMRFYAEACGLIGTSTAVQGHIKTDIAETALMRLSRGSGLEGMCAPRPVSKVGGLTFLRPLLSLSKPEIRVALRAEGLGWVEDESNFGTSFLRNRMRNSVLPAAQEASGGRFADGAARARALLEEDADLVESAFWQNVSRLPGGALAISPFGSGQAAILRRCLVRLAAENASAVRPPAADAFVRECLRGEDAKTSAGSGFVCYDPRSGVMEFYAQSMPENFEVRLAEGENILPGGASLRVEFADLNGDGFGAVSRGLVDESANAWLDADFFPLTARPPRPGDAYAPIGSKSARLVKDMMSSKKTPKMKRKSLPLVCMDSGEPLWAPTLAPAERARLRGPGRAILLTYRPASQLSEF